MTNANLKTWQVVKNFAIDEDPSDISPLGAGHINDTFVIDTKVGKKFCLQRVNHHVFRDVPGMMENIQRVTAHLQSKVAARGGDVFREALTLVPALDGAAYHQDNEGDFWRVYNFVDSACTYDVCEKAGLVHDAAEAFAQFQQDLADLPGARLNETIPAFHDTPKRYERFIEAVEKDELNRASAAIREIDFINARADELSTIIRALSSGEVPERVTHNDTKLNNVLFDKNNDQCLCVIDLDTVMPGSALYDFGDAVRLGACTASEDEVDLSLVTLSLERFEEIAKGYLEKAKLFLQPLEEELLVFSCRLMTFECGMRFLTDHLEGDSYFKVHHEGHNLERCRTQLKMVADMENKAEQMRDIIDKYR